MAIPANTVRVTLKWTPNESDWPNEQAINSFHLRTQDLVPPSPNTWVTKLEEITAQVHLALEASWNAIASFVGSGYQITEIKAAQLDTAGQTLEERVLTVVGGTFVGTGSGGILPPEVAICVGLYGYQPGAFAPKRGQKRGRLFLPYISATKLAANGTMLSTNCDALATAFATVFGSLQVNLESSFIEPVITSNVGATNTVIGWVSVDSHFDSQRRRQHQSPAIKVVKTVP